MTAPPLFPTLSTIKFAGKRSPRLSTLRQQAISGRATFQPQWPAPVWDYELSIAALSGGAAQGALAAGEYQTLVGFFNGVMATPGGLFQWNDVEDNAVAAQLFATGDGTSTVFQLTRPLGGFAEPVLYPIEGPASFASAQDWGNFSGSAGAIQDLGSFTGAVSSSQDRGTFSTLQVFAGGNVAPFALSPGGLVTIVPAPGVGVPLTWTGAYTWLCRFAEDTLLLEQFMFNLWALKKIAFSTIRL